MLLHPPSDLDIGIKTSAEGLDLPALAALGMLAWSGKVDEGKVSRGVRRLEARIAGDDCARQFMVVARSAGAAVGFCRIVCPEGDLARWRLEGLVVHPDHRRRGVGTTVVRYAVACAKARGATSIESQTHADNHASAAFHESFGFRSTGLFTAEDGDRLIGFSLSVRPGELCSPGVPCTDRRSPDMTDRVTLAFVTAQDSPEAAEFLRMGRQYMDEIDPQRDLVHDRFLRSILRRQGEPDRWLAIFMFGQQVAGFAHFKIDNDERPGWGYIMEFYVVPQLRRRGLGRHCILQVMGTLARAGCGTAWLSSRLDLEAFWKACGFDETGQFERDQKIMVASLPHEPANIYDADPHVAEVYDRFETQTDDVEFLRRLIGADRRLRILEPFCGTGRILVPLAADGHEVVGMDVAQAMLDRAAAKVAQLRPEVGGRVRLIRADATAGDWPGGFDLVLLGGNCFYELASPAQQEACIASAAASLRPGGHVYVDNDHMDGELPESWRKVGVKGKTRFPSGMCSDGSKVQGTTETLWFEPRARLWVARRGITVTSPDGRATHRELIEQKHPVSFGEVQGWLETNGFVIERTFGDREGSTYTPDSPRAIFWAGSRICP